MSIIERGGAFVPVIPIGGNLVGLKKETGISFSGRQGFLQLRHEQNSSKFNRSLLNKGLNSKSEKQIAEELLNDLSFEKKDSINYLDNISPSAKKIIILFATFTSAIFTWIITPSKSKIISALFSFIIGGVAYFLLQKFNSKNTVGAQKKILEKISAENLSGDLTEFICSLEKDYSLTSDEMRKELLNVYKRFLMFFLKNSSLDLDEVNKLMSLKKSFGISSQEIGECHYECSQEIFNTNLLFLERTTSNESSQIINKFLFLSDRLFSLDSKKGYQYETSRIKRVLNFTNLEFEENKNKSSEELYIKSIKAVQNSEKIVPENLSDVKQILGITEERSKEINEIFFKEQVQACISKEDGFGAENVEHLKNLKEILEISNEEFSVFLTQESSIFIKNNIEENLQNLQNDLGENDIKKISESLLQNKEKFLVPESTIFVSFLDVSKGLVANNIKTTLSSIKSRAFSDANKKINYLLTLIKNLEKLSISFENTDSSDSQKINEAITEAVQNFSLAETQEILKAFIVNLLEDPELTEDKENSIENLRLVLNISENNSTSIYKNVSGPIFTEGIKKVLDKNSLNDGEKDSIHMLANSLKIDQTLAVILKTSLYREKLKDLVSNKSVFSTQDLKTLDEIRIFLDLSYSNVQTIHDTLCEPIFKKSIQEAMGASGIVPSNYWEGLEKLRKRLRLTEGKAKEVFYLAMKEKLKTLFEKAIAVDKKKKQPKDEAGKDLGDDPTVSKGSGTALGIEAGDPEGGNELLNLVEIYFRNRVFSDKETPTNEQKKGSLRGLNGRTETQMKSRTEISFSYPVTLNGLFDKKVLSDLYKQYLIECFSSKLQSEKRKLFSNLNKLGPILGLESEEIGAIHSNVGVSIYQRFLSQSLSKGYLDNSDTAFLTTIQTTLSMENSVCNQLIKEAKKGVISLAVEKVFASPKVNPENVMSIRKMADQFNIDLDSDLNVSTEQRSKLFRVEIDTSIEKGDINGENLDIIVKIQKFYGLDNTKAKKVLFDCVNTRCEGHLLNAIASLRRSDDVGVLKELENLLNFGEIIPIKFQNNLVSSNEKNQLLSVLKSNFGENETQKKKLKLFETMLEL